MGDFVFADKKIIIASYAHIFRGDFTKLGGPALALRDFLKTRTAKLTCIWQPLPISDTLDVIGELHEHGKLKTWRMRMPNMPWGRQGGINFGYFVLKLRDVLADLFFAFRFRDRYDFFVGVEALNALVGILLRKVGFARKVIYYNLDYGQVRFKNRLLNSVFHALDRLAFRFSDCVWNLSPAMSETRERLAGGNFHGAPQIVVPIGTDTDRIKRLPIEQIERYRLVYLGLLADNCGVPLILDALPAIVEQLPDARLVIVGSGPLENALRNQAEEMGLSSRIDFTGIVPDDMVEKILCKSTIGIAPYLGDPDSIKKFTDVTKPRMYMTCGLPVVITDVPPAAREIAAFKAGIVIRYDKQDLADAVVRILSDQELLKELRRNALSLASRYSWTGIFARTFSDTQAVLDNQAN